MTRLFTATEEEFFITQKNLLPARFLFFPHYKKQVDQDSGEDGGSKAGLVCALSSSSN